VKTTIEEQSRQQNILKVQDTNGVEEDINKSWKWLQADALEDGVSNGNTETRRAR
jgi:hypothetical protein